MERGKIGMSYQLLNILLDFRDYPYASLFNVTKNSISSASYYPCIQQFSRTSCPMLLWMLESRSKFRSVFAPKTA